MMAVAVFATAACARGTCTEPLRASPGTDTSAALAAAMDTLNRTREGNAGVKDWVAESFVRRAGDTVEVGAGPRCWRGTDSPGATVQIVPPSRVVSVYIQLGG